MSICLSGVKKKDSLPRGAHCVPHTFIIIRTKYFVIASVAWQSPGREPYYKTHARYFCTCVEKKAHTNKRVSIIACNNVISKVQCAPITLYEFWKMLVFAGKNLKKRMKIFEYVHWMGESCTKMGLFWTIIQYSTIIVFKYFQKKYWRGIFYKV